MRARESDCVPPCHPRDRAACRGTDRLGPLFEVIAACGPRRGEALGLRWSDSDFTNRTARIRQTVVDVGGRLEFSTPKTKSSEAPVPLTDRTMQALLQWRLGQDIDRQAWGRRTKTTACSSPGRTA